MGFWLQLLRWWRVFRIFLTGRGIIELLSLFFVQDIFEIIDTVDEIARELEERCKRVVP